MKVSVAIPARNEESTLASLLESLLCQTLPPDEILVADGGSTDGTVGVARRFEAQGVRVLELGPAFPGRGRNRGIEAARNEWVALIDAGCRAEPDWLEQLVAARDAALSPPGIVYGNYAPRASSEWEIAQALAYVPPVDPGTACRPPFIASALVQRSAWQKAGGFPEELRAAEDLLFFERVQAAGLVSVRSPRAVIRWSLAPTPGAASRRLRLYSAHHLAAGLFRTWHRRVIAMDVALVALFALGVAWPWAAALALLLALARLFATVWKRRGNVSVNPFRPDRLARVALLLLLADAAVWIGLFDYLRRARTPR